MTATDELRALLDERGVEWGNTRSDGSESDYLTEWRFENGQGKAIAIEWAVGIGLSVEIHRDRLTPAQAIDATLGRGTCHDAAGGQMAFFSCSACGAKINGKHPRFCFGCGREVVDG